MLPSNSSNPPASQKTYYLTTPLKFEDIQKINTGDIVYLSGAVLTARDEAHLRIMEFDKKNQPLPFDLEGAAVYHCGPVMEKTKSGWHAVAAGPTTSDRMTKMTPTILDFHNIRILIGKGGMENIAETLVGKCIYLSYTGGCAALAVDMIQSVNRVDWEDLGMPEAVWELTVKNFGPLVVGIDCHGNDLFGDVKTKAKKRFLEIAGK
ncbi:FumA C-terminus/TtdB family hydratase beta subunit [Methanolapillus ohkumae]|uniref:L(+)-tartrate dehydratase subunit beta n=1 Tax=Methanolapillus ohkumae TaxID=3028298 RepID=A0AA96V5L8_9EURY|nr:L(+)-tartrate dehydratase subunit beta [Methanosarcinaceae archaeon Am2]